MNQSAFHDLAPDFGPKVSKWGWTGRDFSLANRSGRTALPLKGVADLDAVQRYKRTMSC